MAGYLFGRRSCHCEGLPCDQVGHCVTVEWDLEFLDFFVGCNDPRVFGAVSGSVTFYFDPDDASLSKLVCLDGIPVGDDTPYKVADGLWDVPSGASYPLRISGEISPPPDCFGMQVLLTSEFNTGLEWTPPFDGSYQELTEDLSGTPPCGNPEVSIRGTIAMTDTSPSTSGECGCP